MRASQAKQRMNLSPSSFVCTFIIHTYVHMSDFLFIRDDVVLISLVAINHYQVTSHVVTWDNSSDSNNKNKMRKGENHPHNELSPVTSFLPPFPDTKDEVPYNKIAPG